MWHKSNLTITSQTMIIFKYLLVNNYMFHSTFVFQQCHRKNGVLLIGLWVIVIPYFSFLFMLISRTILSPLQFTPIVCITLSKLTFDGSVRNENFFLLSKGRKTVDCRKTESEISWGERNRIVALALIYRLFGFVSEMKQ